MVETRQRVEWTDSELRLVELDLARMFPLASPVVGWADLQWGGTEAESDRLIEAIHLYAECPGVGLFDCCESDLSQCVCSAHQLLDSQTSLDHLLYIYRNRRWYVESEWTSDGTLTALAAYSAFLALTSLS